MIRGLAGIGTLAALGMLAAPAHAGLIAGIDFDVPGNLDNDPNTPNTVLTEPGFASVVATGSKLYNVTTNGITFNVVCPGPTDTALLATVTDAADNSVIGDRSFGSDPTVVTDFAGAYAQGLRDAGILPPEAALRRLPRNSATTDND